MATMRRLAAALAFLCILSPFGAIFGARGSSCCASMKRGTCPMQRRTHDACKSQLAQCRAGANQSGGQGIIDSQLAALERPLTGSFSTLTVPPTSATTLTGSPSMVPRSFTVPPEIRPPREQRYL